MDAADAERREENREAAGKKTGRVLTVQKLPANHRHTEVLKVRSGLKFVNR